MVRGWSRINNFNIEIKLFKKFHNFRRLKIFRGSLKFKKFWNKGTKFKRIRLMRLHHKTNWLIYLNIFKYWVLDVLFTRHYVRFQFFNKFFVNNYIIFDSNYVKRQKLKIPSAQDQWVSVALTRRFFLSLKTPSQSKILKSYQHSSHIHAFFPNEDLIPNWVTLPILSVFDVLGYGLNSDLNHKYECLDLFSQFFSLIFQQHVEIYKILILLTAIKTKINKYVFTFFFIY